MPGATRVSFPYSSRQLKSKKMEFVLLSEADEEEEASRAARCSLVRKPVTRKALYGSFTSNLTTATLDTAYIYIYMIDR